MLAILAEAGSGSWETALAAAIGAGVVAGAQGVQWIRGQVRMRNGNGKRLCNGKPGQTPACIDHMSRLAVVESEQANTKEWLVKLEKKLDRVLEGR